MVFTFQMKNLFIYFRDLIKLIMSTCSREASRKREKYLFTESDDN